MSDSQSGERLEGIKHWRLERSRELAEIIVEIWPDYGRAELTAKRVFTLRLSA